MALAVLAAAVVAALLAVAAAGVWTAFAGDLLALQRQLHRMLSAALRAVGEQGAVAAWSLIGISFLYGVFHAAGPGHGKVVISTYLATQESRLGRGTALSVSAALLQGLVAVAVVEVVVGLIGLGMRDAQGAANQLEVTSNVLIALLGLVIAGTAGRRLLGQVRLPPSVPGHAGGDGPHHGHDHDRHHGHHHDHGPHDGHSHGPTAADLARPASLTHMAGLVLSVGVRPCTGAILVLLLAHVLELAWAGLAAVLAMSIGTAITVSLLATLSVYARKAMLRVAGRLSDGHGSPSLVIDLVALGGGLAVVALGLTLLQLSLTTGRPPLL